MNQICVRSGEKTVILDAEKFKVEISLTEMRLILGWALIGSGKSRPDLEVYILKLQNAVSHCISTQTRMLPSDDAANLKRYHETGRGGSTDLTELDSFCGQMEAEARERANDYLASFRG